MKKKLKQINPDYQVLEKETSPQDLIYRTVQKALRPKLPVKEPMDPEKRRIQLERQKKKRSEKEKRDRKRRIKEGLCTKCGKYPPFPGGRLCDICRARGVLNTSNTKTRKDYSK